MQELKHVYMHRIENLYRQSAVPLFFNPATADKLIVDDLQICRDKFSQIKNKYPPYSQ
jgi:hypothetical protein